MITIKGKYNTTIIYTNKVEQGVIDQIQTYINSFVSKDQNIAIMPDTHNGKGCVIGFTATLNKYIIPNIVGVDIGCGVISYNLGKLKKISFEKLDNFIKQNIPHGFDKNKTIPTNIENKFKKEIKEIVDKLNLHLDEVLKAIGSLGGGNHFIELGIDKDQNYWLTIHSGSRNFGLQIANYHQNIANKYCKEKGIEIPNNLCFLEGNLKEQYLQDMNIAQKYAILNRYLIAQKIIKNIFNKDIDNLQNISSIHNYIDLKNKIIRKGAISAMKGEYTIIPFNMRDGLIIGIGKGNKNWNFSAPHGAGRLLSRKQAKKKLDINEFKKSMEGIYTTCINKSTIDESPFVYKDYKEIVEKINETVEIKYFIKPVYNFKAAE